MKTLLIFLLSCVSVLGGETDIRVFSTAQTNAESATTYKKDVFTRDGQTNLIRITNTKAGRVLRIYQFYHFGQLVGNFVATPDESTFNTEAGPYCQSLKFEASGEVRSARIGDKDGDLLDEFSYTNGIFSPVEGPLRRSGLMKPQFANQPEFLKPQKQN